MFHFERKFPIISISAQLKILTSEYSVPFNPLHRYQLIHAPNTRNYYRAK